MAADRTAACAIAVVSAAGGDAATAVDPRLTDDASAAPGVTVTDTVVTKVAAVAAQATNLAP
jgi:hypothetical protein